MDSEQVFKFEKKKKLVLLTNSGSSGSKTKMAWLGHHHLAVIENYYIMNMDCYDALPIVIISLHVTEL